MIGCHCDVCQSEDVRNVRRRSSLYVSTDATAFVIDTPPDFRQRLCLRIRGQHALVNRVEAADVVKPENVIRV